MIDDRNHVDLDMELEVAGPEHVKSVNLERYVDAIFMDATGMYTACMRPMRWFEISVIGVTCHISSRPCTTKSIDGVMR
jgi:hypothetical protein